MAAYLDSCKGVDLRGRVGPGPQYLNWVGAVVKGSPNILLHEQPTTAASRLLKLSVIAIVQQATAQSNHIRFHLSITPMEATYHGGEGISCNTNADVRCVCSS